MPKKFQKLKDLTPHYYVYFNDDKCVVAVTNVKNSNFEYFIEIDFNTYDRFITGIDKFEDFRIGTVIDVSGNITQGLISCKRSIEHSFKNRLLSWIEDDNKSSDISIVWDEGNDQWMFGSSANLKKRFYGNDLPVTEILFFIILGNDPNFLVRTITINIKNLIDNPIVVKFNTTWERTIDTISITSNISDLGYSLNVWSIDDNN